MEILLLKLQDLGIKTVFHTDFNTPTSCFRTQIAFSKNDGEWRIKPIFHKGHAAPEDEIKNKLNEFLQKIGKLKEITVLTKTDGHGKEHIVGIPERKVENCPKCNAFCFSIQDNICLSCGHERKSFAQQHKDLHDGKNPFIPMGDIYTPEVYPERHSL